jgi:hypothetical protein
MAKAKGNPEYEKVMNGVRGNDPALNAKLRKAAEKQAKIDKAAADNARRRKQKPRTGSGHDDVIDTGMFR